MENDLRLVTLEKRDGADMGVRQTVGVLVSVTILLMVGLYTYVKVSNSIPQTGFTAADNTTFENIKTNTRSAFDLASVIPIVMGAAAIISLLYLAFA